MTQIIANNSSILNYNKSTRYSKSQNNFHRNYSNPQYHTGIDLAKTYSGLVNTHLYMSKQENHTLKSACRTYHRQISGNKGKGIGNGQEKFVNTRNIANNSMDKNNSEVKLKRSTSASHVANLRSGFSTRSIKPIKLQNNRIVINPQDGLNANNSSISQKQKQKMIQNSLDQKNNSKIQQHQKLHTIQLKSVLSRKTQRVPQYSSQVQQVCNWKLSLQEQIKTLKRMINSQKKHKSKISISCNKLMNERENVYKQYQTKAQENYHLSVTIDQTIKQNISLAEQIQIKTNRNQQTKQNVAQTQIQVYELKNYVDKTRLVVMGEEKDVSKLKTMVSISYNNMSNNYMNVNLLKGEKALLLADIDSQHARNK